MVSNTNSNTMAETSSPDSPSTTEILIKELKSCLDTLQYEQNMCNKNYNSEVESGDEEIADMTRYKWLADGSPNRRRPSRQLLDDMTLSEITDICQRIVDADIVNILREMHSHAHLCVSPIQLLSHVKYLLSECLAHQHTPAVLHSESGRSTPTGRRKSMSGVLAGFKAFRRNRTTTSSAQTSTDFDIEARQTTV